MPAKETDNGEYYVQKGYSSALQKTNNKVNNLILYPFATGLFLLLAMCFQMRSE